MRLYLTLLCIALAPPATLADIQIRKSGSSWATLEDNGTIRISGASVG